jgi:hypothetical protein
MPERDECAGVECRREERVVRRIRGVRPDDGAVAVEVRRGPGSEKRTRLLDFGLGVREGVLERHD